MKKSTSFFSFAATSFGVFIQMVMLMACGKDNPKANIYTPVLPDSIALNKAYLALGDSYTIGQSVSSDQQFPVQTTALLNIQGLHLKQPQIIARTGWTTGDLLSTLSSTTLGNSYDIVTLLIGVNNQYQGRSQAEYRTQFTELLNKAIFYAASRKNRVFVLSIPDYSVTPFAQGSDTAKIAREINEFNAINKEISLGMGVVYLDITGISREARTDISLIAVDGLHPSGKQYGRWSALLAPLIKASF